MTHYSSGRFYWLNAGCFYLLDVGLLFFVVFFLLIAFGVSLEILLFYLVWVFVYGFF